MESHLNIDAILSATEIRRGSHPSRPRFPGGKSAVRPPESEKTDEIIKAPLPGLAIKVNVTEGSRVSRAPRKLRPN
jgi:biotin carboxyl carrier protein